jgi:hypothetical protein
MSKLVMSKICMWWIMVVPIRTDLNKYDIFWKNIIITRCKHTTCFSAGSTSSILVNFSKFLYHQAYVIIRHILYFKHKYLLQFQWLTITYARVFSFCFSKDIDLRFKKWYFKSGYLAMFGRYTKKYVLLWTSSSSVAAFIHFSSTILLDLKKTFVKPLPSQELLRSWQYSNYKIAMTWQPWLDRQ